MVKNMPAMQETQVQSLGQRSPGGGNDNQLQSSCLENPMDRGVWWATVHGVAKSQTQQKQLRTHTYAYIYIYISKYIHTDTFSTPNTFN